MTKETPTTDKKASKENSQKTEKNINMITTNKEKTSAGEPPNSAKEETSIASKDQPEDKSKVTQPNETSKLEK